MAIAPSQQTQELKKASAAQAQNIPPADQANPAQANPKQANPGPDLSQQYQGDDTEDSGSDPMCQGVTDPGARSMLQAMYNDFINSMGSKEVASFVNLKAAFVWAEEQNFQVAMKKMGRDGAMKLENLMSAVQAEGYGGDTADMYYMRWAVLASRNQSRKNKPRSKQDGDGSGPPQPKDTVGSEPTASSPDVGNGGAVQESFPSLVSSRKDDISQIRTLLSKIEGEDPTSDQVKLSNAIAIAEKQKLIELADILRKALEISRYQFVMFDDVRANVRQAQEIVSGIRESMVDNTFYCSTKILKSKIGRFQEAMLDISESEAQGKKDAASFTYEQAQGLLGDISEQILLYFVPVGIKAADVQQMQQQNLDAVMFPVPVIAGLTMDENVARVAAGDDGVYFARLFDKDQIAGGYSLSVGFKAPQFEYEKEILVIADEIDGPDDSRIVFELDEAQFVGQNQENGASQQDGMQNDASAPQQQQDASAPTAPRQPGKVPPKTESRANESLSSASVRGSDFVSGRKQKKTAHEVQPNTARCLREAVPGQPPAGPGAQNGSVSQAPPSPAQGNGAVDPSQGAGGGASFQVQPTDYGQTAIVQSNGIVQEWLKALRQSAEGQQMSQNSAQRVQAAIDQNQKIQASMGKPAKKAKNG